MKKIKIKLIVEDGRKDERDCFFLTGVRKSNKIEIVENEEEADYVFCHRSTPSKTWLPPTLKDQNKLIIFDYTDHWDNVDYFDDYGHYFKRSCTVKNYVAQRLIPQMSKDNFHGLPYSIKYVNDKDVHEVLNLNDIKKTIDISCFFNPSNQRDIRSNAAMTTQNFCKKHNLKCHIGSSGNGEISYNGRENFIKKYYEINKASKIVVTANHNNWEGDWRFYESLSTGTVVFIDKMMVPLDHPFIDGKHVVFYNDMQDLSKKLLKYYNNEKVLERISLESKNFVYNYHKPENRMDYFINTITK